MNSSQEDGASCAYNSPQSGAWKRVLMLSCENTRLHCEYMTRAAILTSLLLTLAPAVRGAIIANGGFELPHVSPYTTFVPSTQIDGGWWVLGPAGSSVTVVPVSWYGGIATEGVQQLAFNAGSSSGAARVSQQFATVIGATYTVTFDVGYGGYLQSPMGLQAEVMNSANNTLASLTAWAPSSGLSHYNTGFSLSFAAVESLTTLSFTDISTNTVSVDALLDNVRVSGPSAAVPDSAAPWLILLSLTGLAAVHGRRART